MGTALSGTKAAVHAMPEHGDIWVVSQQNFGTGNGASTGTPPTAGGTYLTDFPYEMVNVGLTTAFAEKTNAIAKATFADGMNFAYLHEGRTSVQTSDYFAVGSTLTGDDYNSNNLYRKFKVTGHVTNEFNREFAKLDTFPADDGITPASTNADKPDYNLKITSNNATVHTYPSVPGRINVNEVQVIVMGTGQTDESGQIFKLYYKGEESQDMTQTSHEDQVAEEINGFSALSGPVTVAKEGTKFLVTFEKDGDVAQ